MHREELKFDSSDVTGSHQALAGETAPARVKILNPLTSTGPSMHAELLGSSDRGLQVRVPRCILVGSTVQVRTQKGIAFGEVRSSAQSGSDYEIGVLVQRSC